MFEAIRNNKRIAQAILGILIVPFAFFGLDSYFGDNLKSREIATVGGSPISQNEFVRALGERQNSLQAQFGDSVATEMVKSEKLRQEVLDQLIVQRVLALYAKEVRLSVSAGHMQQELAGIEGFQENGQFSIGRYKESLRQAGKDPAAFEAQLAQELLIQQLGISISGSSLVARDSARRLLVAEGEERTVREMRFPVAPHLANIRIDDAAIRKFYDDNPAQFELPERIKAEYLVFREAPEERNVRHILIELASNADAAAVEAAKKQAEEIAVALRKNPSSFPALAKEKSQDPGSSEKGGDLGYFTHGVMEPQFEKAAFALELNEISDPVRTDFGFHILQVTAIQKQPLGNMHDEAAGQLQKQTLGVGFDEKAEKFSNMVYNESPDSLQPVAETFGLEIKRTGWITRGAGALGDVNSEKLVSRLFEEDSLIRRNNTQAIDVGPNMLAAARVLEHEIARRMPLEDVRGQIEAQLRRDEAMRMAREESKTVLAALDRGESASNAWSSPRSFLRSKPDLPPLAARAVFAVPVMQLPARVAAEFPDDAYVIYLVDEVEQPSIENDDPRVDTLAKQYGLLLGQNDFNSFILSLRDRYKIVTKPVADQATE